MMKSNAVLPKLPAAPILPAAFTVGRLLQSSGVSLAGEYQIDIPLDVPPSRSGHGTDVIADLFEHRRESEWSYRRRAEPSA
ncbi:MAG: hypothetical protein IPM54_33410 [Polyangiaceae bacterium]|nr:hypothetical protein [Polyangiaceae bacterium]